MTASEIAQRPRARSQTKNRYRNRLTDTLTRKRSLGRRPCHIRACEYGVADSGCLLGRVLPGWCLAVPGDSIRA